MVAVWIILCLLFPPIIPLVIVGALISMCCNRRPLAPYTTMEMDYFKKRDAREWNAFLIAIGIIAVALTSIMLYGAFYGMENL